MMQKGKKAMSVLLMMGMLTTAGASLALAADAGGAEAPDRPRGGGMFLNEEWLTDEIAGLDAQQQAEILALQAELAALQPEKEPREKQALTTEEQAVLDEYQAQIQAKEEAITAILQEAGVTLTAPDKPDQTTIVRIFSEQADGAERTLPKGGRGNLDGSEPRNGFVGRLVSAETMAQLDDETKAQIRSLEDEIKTLRSSLAAELGLKQPEQIELTAIEQATMEKARTIRQELQQALQEAGITLPQPPAKEAEQA